MEMYGRTLPSMLQDNATCRSFASLRITNDAIPVILSVAKDLYETSGDYILQIPQLSVKNQIYVGAAKCRPPEYTALFVPGGRRIAAPTSFIVL